jgi:hypothetical protein
MPYRARLFDRFDQLISFKDLDSPAEAGRWITQAWETLLSERVGPPDEREPANVRHELTFVDADEQERPTSEDESREFAEALARD